MYLSMQAWEDLQILRLVLILLSTDLRNFCMPLLLSLPGLHPLLYGQVLTKISELVASQAQLVQHGTVADRIKNDMVVRSI